MSDTGLKQAIGAAGGVRAMARKVGVSAPTVHRWTRVPVERLVAVEEITGVEREQLRPDIPWRRIELTSRKWSKADVEQMLKLIRKYLADAEALALAEEMTHHLDLTPVVVAKLDQKADGK